LIFLAALGAVSALSIGYEIIEITPAFAEAVIEFTQI
jgi:hypothetical protein